MASLDVVLAALTAPRHGLASAMPDLPAAPGLYAIYCDSQACDDIRLSRHPVDSALYVGKAEDSLVMRDIKTHFGDGRTGSSTVRRSFAALLREHLGLTGIPRNPAKPSHFSNFGLSPEDDAKLTAWMRDRLRIAVWPSDGDRPLRAVELDVLARWQPPLNISDVTHDHRDRLRAERKVMADQARAWRPSTTGS